MPATHDESRLDADRRKALGLAISQIEKQLGKGAIMRMGADTPRVKVAAIPTGAINLDAATGVGGIPLRPNHRNLRTRVLRQDYPHPSPRSQCAEDGRRRCLC